MIGRDDPLPELPLEPIEPDPAFCYMCNKEILEGDDFIDRSQDEQYWAHQKCEENQ